MTPPDVGGAPAPDREPASAPDRELDAALAGLAASARERGVVVATDFDGVLADLVDDPAASRPRPEATVALARLARLVSPGSGVVLALVSGRDLATLARLSDAPAGSVLVGSHGAERGHVAADGSLVAEPLVLPDADAARLAAVVEVLEDVAARAEGAWVERKPTSAVLHVRLVPPGVDEELRGLALERVRALGVDAMLGKDVVDCGVVATSKGHALTALRAATGPRAGGTTGAGPGAAPGPGADGARVLYLGDDVTDERAFAMLAPDDVTVRVGPGETAARFRVAGTAAAALVLSRTADHLEAAP